MKLDNHPVGTREKAAERRLQVLELRKGGASLRQIARQIGCGTSQVHRDLWQALDELSQQQRGKADSLRQLELERLDRYLLRLDGAISQGNPRAIMAAVRIMERRAKFLGLDATMLEQQPADPSALLALLTHGNGNGANGTPKEYDA